MKKCVIIYNPLSGRKVKEKFLPKFPEILKSYGYDADIISTEYKKHATDIVEKLPNDIDLVISIGGDGTFNEVMTGNLKRKKRLLLAHLPLGTTNDIGTMFGYGKNTVDNLKKTLDGVKKQVDICLINNKPFVYVAGIGKFTNVAYETPRNLKKKFGYLAYIKEGVKSFFNKTELFDVTYEVDGEKYRGLFSFIIISSANRIAGINNFYKDVKLDDDRFEVLLCNVTKRKDIVKSLAFLTMYDVSKVPGLYFYKTNNIKMKFHDYPKKDWCIDGEELEEKTRTFNIAIENGIEMLIPRKKIDELFVKNEK